MPFVVSTFESIMTISVFYILDSRNIEKNENQLVNEIGIRNNLSAYQIKRRNKFSLSIGLNNQILSCFMSITCNLGNTLSYQSVTRVSQLF